MLRLFHHFLRKANANDLKRKDWEGDADVNWKKPNGITREGLRDLLRAGNYEKRYEEAYKQLIEEEKSFLEEAKTNLRTALEDFPYEDVTFDGGFNLLVEDTFLDFYGYKMYCKQCEEPDHGFIKSDSSPNPGGKTSLNSLQPRLSCVGF